MATVSNSPVVFPRGSVSDQLIRSSGAVSLRALGRARFTVSAKRGKGKRKMKYPWPDNVDPNTEGGELLVHLSKFKPLKERPKPVTLEFEKPLVEIEKKIDEVRKMADQTGLDFSDQIMLLQNKYQQALTGLYKHLTPIQRVHIARHPNRPTFLDHVFAITDKFVELHGDRGGYDDPAIVTGIGSIDGERYMFIGHQKGRNTKESIERNFGMPTPHGYRKALRLMEYADHHGFPIVTFVDTPGAYADLKSEYLGQGEAIAHNLRSMFGLKVPVVSIVIGEGGSGGALAIACANKMLMLENAVFYVASPEACAAILWKSSKAAPKAAEKLKITASELCKLQIADGIIPEPLGGAHSDPSWTSQQIKAAIKESMHELKKMDPEELLNHRYQKYRKLSMVGEGVPLDPIKMVNMKKRDKTSPGKIPDAELAAEVENLRQQIQKAKESSSETPVDLNEMVDKLKREVDLEFSEAIKALGLNDKLVSLRNELSEKANSEDQPMDTALLDKIEMFKNEINQGLTSAPNYASLKSKLDMLQELSKAKKVSKNLEKAATLKQVIVQKLQEVRDRPSIKEKLESLKAEIGSSGISKFSDFPDEMKGKIVSVKQEIESEVADAIKSMGLDVQIVKSKFKDLSDQTPVVDIKHKMEELNKEISQRIQDVISSSELKNMVELLRLEMAKAGGSPDSASKKKIEVLEKQIKQSLAEALSSSELKEKHEKLIAEVFSTTVEASGESGASIENESSERGDKYDRPIVNLSASNGFA